MKDLGEIIRNASFSKKVLFAGMQLVTYASAAVIMISLVTPPVNLAVVGVCAALSSVSFAGQAILGIREAKRQAKKENTDDLLKKYSPKTNAKSASRPTNEKSLQQSSQKPAQKQVPKVQRSADVKRETPSIRLSAAELKEIQKSRQRH